MKQAIERQGINQVNGGYQQLVSAGTYRIDKEKRTNVLGYGIVARGSDGKPILARTVGDAFKLIRKDAVNFATNLVGDKASVLVIWRVEL